MRQFRLPAPFYRVWRLKIAEDAPLEAQDRLRWVQAWEALRRLGLTATQASSELGLSRATLFRWRRQVQRHGVRGLADRSRRPHRVRRPTWSTALAQAVLRQREQWPRWGKAKLGPLLRAQGWEVAESRVGRILTHLKRTGQLREPPFRSTAVARRRLQRPYATRKPKDYQPTLPGDLVQVDTVDLRPLPGVVLKQFTAIDVVSRWSVVAVRTRATATAAAQFLDDLQARLPSPVRAIQVDGGSEFMAEFEQACQQRGLRLFVLPPRSPKLNGCVERANRTHREEFWDCYDGDLDLSTAQAALLDWERCYNTVRPHQALDYRTPLQYLKECHPDAPQQSHM